MWRDQERGLGEGQGCVYNVNKLKATATMVRGEGLIRSHILSPLCLMVLFSKVDAGRMPYK